MGGSIAVLKVRSGKTAMEQSVLHDLRHIYYRFGSWVGSSNGLQNGFLCLKDSAACLQLSNVSSMPHLIFFIQTIR